MLQCPSQVQTEGQKAGTLLQAAVQGGRRLAQLAKSGECAKHEMLDAMDDFSEILQVEHNHMRQAAGGSDDSDDSDESVDADAWDIVITDARSLVSAMILEHMRLTAPGAQLARKATPFASVFVTNTNITIIITIMFTTSTISTIISISSATIFTVISFLSLALLIAPFTALEPDGPIRPELEQYQQDLHDIACSGIQQEEGGPAAAAFWRTQQPWVLASRRRPAQQHPSMSAV